MIPQMNSIRKIIEARNAIIQADSNHAIRACLGNNLPDRGGEYFPIGASVQLAVDKQWVGTFRVIAHSAGNLLVGRGNKILKWPKCKTRMVHLEHNDDMDRIHIPVDGRTYTKRRRWLADEYPEEYQPAQADLPEQEIDSREIIDVRDSPISERELMRVGQQTLDAPDEDGYGPSEDAMDVGIVWDALGPGQTRPEGTYVIHGSLICDLINEKLPGDRLDPTYIILPNGAVFARRFLFPM